MSDTAPSAAPEAARVLTLRDGREARIVPADNAGEVYLYVADGLIAHMAERYWTHRQADAARELARLYSKGGGRVPWKRTAGSGPPEEVVAAARQEYRALLSAAPRRCQAALECLAMGEWVTSYDPREAWATGLDAVADRMGLAR